jgi:hypothetical protein
VLPSRLEGSPGFGEGAAAPMENAGNRRGVAKEGSE